MIGIIFGGVKDVVSSKFEGPILTRVERAKYNGRTSHPSTAINTTHSTYMI